MRALIMRALIMTALVLRALISYAFCIAALIIMLECSDLITLHILYLWCAQINFFDLTSLMYNIAFLWDQDFYQFVSK